MKGIFKSTLIGFCAVVLWGMLALLTAFTGSIPPFQLTAMTFALACFAGGLYFVYVGCPFAILKQPLGVWLNGIGGLFGYHALYFMAMKKAPTLEVSLIAYLWPILIVLFTTFLPGEKLRLQHLVGVIMGFLGIFLLVIQKGQPSLAGEHLLGYLLAAACAVIWSLYSVVSRRNKEVPTLMIGFFCGITACLALLAHLTWEVTVIPQGIEWGAVLALGLGPVGMAFFAWDYGVKNGNIKLLGTLAYMAPLISTLLLILAGHAEFTWNVALACICIVSGPLIASFK
ncbi:MAG TPA: EamA family transporter [Candidatus Avacidaminococcus intestinavium]|uniref:EamA family transporter n=1 Tax=Candidatus Avacidaminococcus intestinavium TaxID=2840684 RepID=A0A9D1SKF3_9FIRM|nr:EamA family transporter [Candidatus Avacidaminococcus intestinavium]